MGVWGYEAGQSESDAVRASHIEERLESFWTSSRIDPLCDYQRTPSRRRYADTSCVAELVDGGDVMIGEEVQQGGSAIFSTSKESAVKQRVALQVSSHRKFVEASESNPHNPTLHRVVLATRGRSMVLYTSLLELLSAAECAAEGMQAILPLICL